MSIPDLLQQLPETDREIEAKQPPPENADPQKRRRNQLPESWGNASKFTGPDPALARKLVTAVFAGGRKGLQELIALLNGAADYKAEYLLHCMAIYGDERQRTLLAKTIAAELDQSKARQVLIRELQWLGNPATAPALGKYLTDERLCADAAAALTSIGGDAAAAEFRKAFPKSIGKARIIIAQHLGVLRDARSAEALRKASRDSDAQLRRTAAWALACIEAPHP